MEQQVQALGALAAAGINLRVGLAVPVKIVPQEGTPLGTARQEEAAVVVGNLLAQRPLVDRVPAAARMTIRGLLHQVGRRRVVLGVLEPQAI